VFGATDGLAAMRAGITSVIIPKLNEKDLVDVPEEAKQKLKFIPVENVDEVLAAALENNGATKQQSGGSASPKTMANNRGKAA
jgi:ATP-dependent Lon protease